MEHVSGNIVDIFNKRIYPGTIEVLDGEIAHIKEESNSYEHYIIPGFIDSHIHIESSMLTPSAFASIAVSHGTVATVSDPHEIANIMGLDGVYYMIRDASKTPFKSYFGAPSCVPATIYETSGSRLGVEEVETLLRDENILFLSEVMNVPGVINREQELMEKIALSIKYGKKIDGHAPGLRGEALKLYINAGITTDHESLSLEEAEEKIKNGMSIQIREGSGAKNFDTLYKLIDKYPDRCMFCSDDLHPDDLVKGHINKMVVRAVDAGINIWNVLRCASLNPVKHYGLNVGLLRKHDPADFIIVDNLKEFNILKTYIDGECVADSKGIYIDRFLPERVNNFNVGYKKEGEFSVEKCGGLINVIGAIDGELITERLLEEAENSNGEIISDTNRDILKIAVVNRYKDAPISIGFIKNFGFKEGAIASSVAHDSHNIVAVGVSNKDICRAVNLIIEHRGGLSAVSKNREKILPLPIGGIMSDRDGYTVAKDYAELNRIATKMGTTLRAPFMTLSFMALLVIPHIK
ncbi:MAG: adenine deaminase, partial [Nitrospirae bacterium]